MKSVLVFRFSPTEQPGYLETFLNERGIHWQLIKLDEGQTVPAFNQEVAAVALMGGPMSVNDDLSWRDPIINFIQAAVAADVPVIGHCLGGQFLAKALGAEVSDNACWEVGWGEVAVEDTTAAEWFGGLEKFDVFHWHYQTFGIPAGAKRVMSSKYCTNQAYVFNGLHIGFQCHIEMTEAMVKKWCEDSKDDLDAMSMSESVMTKQQILSDVGNRVASLNHLAKSVYQRWIAKARLDS
jgi:GMP synthase-like glutamine amidotransferase